MPSTRIITSPDEAAAILREGGLVAVPTETVYGLGARADDAEAVARIFAAKSRPADNPLILHVAGIDHVGLYAARIPAHARALMDAFWPGPLTLILPARESVPRIVTADLDTVGVRMPDHPVTLSVIRELGTAIAAPSANRSGRPSPTTWEAVRDDLDGRIEAVLQGEPTTVGLESTVLDCTADMPVVLRPGGISLQQLQTIHPATRDAMEQDKVHRSPGTRHKHYRPNAEVRWVGPFDGTAPVDDIPETTTRAAYIGCHAPPDEAGFFVAKVVPTLEVYARELFRFFRECEALGVEVICCERIPPEGLGQALIDRIDRAAG